MFMKFWRLLLEPQPQPQPATTPAHLPGAPQPNPSAPQPNPPASEPASISSPQAAVPNSAVQADSSKAVTNDDYAAPAAAHSDTNEAMTNGSVAAMALENNQAAASDPYAPAMTDAVASESTLTPVTANAGLAFSAALPTVAHQQQGQAEPAAAAAAGPTNQQQVQSDAATASTNQAQDQNQPIAPSTSSSSPVHRAHTGACDSPADSGPTATAPSGVDDVAMEAAHAKKPGDAVVSIVMDAAPSPTFMKTDSATHHIDAGDSSGDKAIGKSDAEDDRNKGALTAEGVASAMEDGEILLNSQERVELDVSARNLLTRVDALSQPAGM
jgi:hypothetical protein